VPPATPKARPSSKKPRKAKAKQSAKPKRSGPLSRSPRQGARPGFTG
jgi:hypothetical protein